MTANEQGAAEATSRSKKWQPLSRSQQWRRHLIRALLLVGGAYLAICVLMMFLEKSLIFFPSSDGDWQPAWLKYEDAHFQAADGTKLHGWYLDQPQARQVVLFAHGNAGNLSHRAQNMARLRRMFGVSVMIFDYRGYGKSEGSPDEAGILADARAARAWLAQRTGKQEQDIVLMGESLGGGVLVHLAADDGARGLILQNTFTSLSDVGAHHYPWLPVRLLIRTRVDAAAKIPSYRGPLLQSHAAEDEIVPFVLGKKLFELAGSQQKKFVPQPGNQHNDDPMSPEYERALREFLESLPD